MKKTKLQYSGLITALVYSLTIFSLSISHVSLADDTETLLGAGGQAWSTPNVLFIIDTSGSMAWDKTCVSNCRDLADTNPNQKLYIVKQAYTKLMNDFSGINVALMRFDGTTSRNGGSYNKGGYFISPMQELNSTNRSNIISAASSLTAQGRTPLAETLYEAARFYRGMSVDFGDSTTPGTNVSGVLDPNNSNNYQSPALYQCQANYIVLLTDGEPKADFDADSSIPNLPNYNSGSCSFVDGSSDCLDNVAEYLHTVDISSAAGFQNVDTYTIGFTTNQQLLQDTANKGGGRYIQANDATSLESAFNTILKTVINSNNSFSPPAIAANAFNSVSDYNKLYFTLFEPSAKPKWDGNIKPYTLSGDPPEVTDAAGVAAISAQGFFKDTSRSLWSSVADGGSIAEGGANGNLPTAAKRNLYTFTGTYTNGVPDSSATSFPTLSNPNNALKNAPSSELTAAMLGLSNPDPVALDAAFTSVIDTIRSDTLGDPLHSKPILVNYGGTAANPDLTLFAATNAGFLHAIDATTGVEQFGFIPQELLQQLPTLTQNGGRHLYGLDGDVTAWVEDNNSNGIIEKANNDHVYVYVGMRRGGNSRSNNYYALDVTTRSKPELKWVIKGGSGQFAELGQTWSRPELTTIKYGAGTRKVLIFGGGYDTAEDSNPVYQP
ncbi:MAG: hypothetical protein R3240_10465, partial [Gammaproteobacteria bacterium]|nr:hypothetical protein [Gammaproteobacteria bacterium]